ncbi:hypothetical protein L0V05_08725 [Tabrizicola sp. J26]|uniref:hypothetical protein n=1 Tax=Alitabrizicola rongguiensis TaxID=2909234 RepID=UPI001F28639C|nr:hypothetical protein [Tabrizicola rongguiensis]MCF1708897.1 hypothetical protein [Tabrizicola rongguiensis]
MKFAFVLLMMTTALGAGSAALAGGQGLSLTPGAGLSHRVLPDPQLTLIDDDEDEDGGSLWSSSDDDDDCGDDDEESCAAGTAGDAAKAGTVAPPKNGLFTNGTAPVVKSN